MNPRHPARTALLLRCAVILARAAQALTRLGRLLLDAANHSEPSGRLPASVVIHEHGNLRLHPAVADDLRRRADLLRAQAAHPSAVHPRWHR